jgi:histidyl-tRNA synthetase
MSDSSLQAPRGTRDFYPADMRLRSWLFGHFREVARRFGFEEVDGPIVEHEELFTRKAGEEIVEQLYHFEMHGRRLALRPEMTPQVARMVMARAGSLRLPLRWFAVTQNWRYERTTRGRRREHFQWNMDIWGERGVAAEAELLAAIFCLLDRLGLGEGQVRVQLNSRALLEETLRAGVLRGRPEIFAPLCVIIDKLAKIGADAVREQLSDPAGPVRLAPSEAGDVVSLLQLRDLEAAAAAAPPGSAAVRDLLRLFELLDAYGIAGKVDFDASVVRGLAYYTGIVFEAYDSERKLRAVCGGGRYDGLLETLGGPPIPAVGFGFGDVVIGELLADRGLLPALPRGLEDVVAALGEAQRPAAIRLACGLRARGRAVELLLGDARPKRVLEDADRAGAQRVLFVGPDEAARGVARVRTLATGAESEEPIP